MRRPLPGKEETCPRVPAVRVERHKQLCEGFRSRIGYMWLCNKAPPNLVPYNSKLLFVMILSGDRAVLLHVVPARGTENGWKFPKRPYPHDGQLVLAASWEFSWGCWLGSLSSPSRGLSMGLGLLAA